MKITAVETLRLDAHPNLLWVQLATDAGLTGLGETWFGADAVEADIHGRMAGDLLGADPARIQDLNRRLTPYTGFTGTGAEMRALSAVDVALWDLAGKAVGVALCDLLGGRCRTEIPVYNTCAGPHYVSKTQAVRPDNFGLGAGGADSDEGGGAVYEDLDGFRHRPAELARSLQDMGIGAMKIWPFDFAAGAGDGIAISAADLDKALAPFVAIRQACGPAMRIKAELHGLWSLEAAATICRALAPIGIDWVEDPLWMDRTDDLARLAVLAETLGTPLAGGETLAGLGAFRHLIDHAGIATPIMDVVWAGGVTAARKIAALAEARARPIAFHDCSGPVTLAVSTHLALALPNVREQEIVRAFYYGWYQDLVDQPPPLKDGMLTVPDGPGLGLTLNPDLARRADAHCRRTTHN